MNFDLTINISRTELLEMICEKLKEQGFSDISYSNINFEIDDGYSVTGVKVRNIQLRKEQIEAIN